MRGEINRGVKRSGEYPHFASQSRKSRRLDCQFNPRYEDEAISCEAEQRLLLDQPVTSRTAVHNDDVSITDITPTVNPPGDRPLVQFHPANLLKSLSSPMLQIKVHPDIVDDLRNYQYQITRSYTPEVRDQPPNYPSAATNLAVIPWVDPNIAEQPESWEPMEADNDFQMMDTEECKESTNTSGGLQQQPQHCLWPQVSQNKAFPVQW